VSATSACSPRSAPLRADFVPPEHAAIAYLDEPVPIGHDQVTTKPSLSARMIEGLRDTWHRSSHHYTPQPTNPPKLRTRVLSLRP
jgi:hypothetical protein